MYEYLNQFCTRKEREREREDEKKVIYLTVPPHWRILPMFDSNPNIGPNF